MPVKVIKPFSLPKDGRLVYFKEGDSVSNKLAEAYKLVDKGLAEAPADTKPKESE